MARIYYKQGFLLFIFLIMAMNVSAQSWQIGAQQGISYWLTRKAFGIGRLRTLPGQHLTWDKELVLKYQSKKKLGFELGVGTYHFKQQTLGSSTDYVSVNGNTNALSLRMAAMYDVTYPLLQYMFPRMAAMKSYIGFTCMPTMLWDRVLVESATDEPYQIHQTRFTVWVGFSYTHEIPLTKRIFLTSQFAFQGRPFVKYRGNEEVLPFPNKRMNIQSGIRFKL